MKKIILLFVSVFALTSVTAQEEGKFRFDFNIGYAIPKGGGGVLVNLEPKYNIKDNMSVGLRFGSAVMAKEIEFEGEGENANGEAKIAANGSYLGTFEYNFNNGDSSFAPYVGAGLGYFSVANVGLDVSSSGNGESNQEIEGSGKFGGMIRGGFDWGKFRLALEYNIIPKSELSAIDGTKIGTTKNSYVGVSLGFFLGGGKWGQ